MMCYVIVIVAVFTFCQSVNREIIINAFFLLSHSSLLFSFVCSISGFLVFPFIITKERKRFLIKFISIKNCFQHGLTPLNYKIEDLSKKYNIKVNGKVSWFKCPNELQDAGYLFLHFNMQACKNMFTIYLDKG